MNQFGFGKFSTSIRDFKAVIRGGGAVSVALFLDTLENFFDSCKVHLILAQIYAFAKYYFSFSQKIY